MGGWVGFCDTISVLGTSMFPPPDSLSLTLSIALCLSLSLSLSLSFLLSFSLLLSLSLSHTRTHKHTHTHAHIHTHIHKHIDPKLRWDDKQWGIDTLTFPHDTIWKPDTKIYEQMEGEFPAQVFPCHKYINESSHRCMNDSCHTCGMSFVTRICERIMSHFFISLQAY